MVDDTGTSVRHWIYWAALAASTFAARLGAQVPSAVTPRGVIAGSIVNASTSLPLPGTSVRIVGTTTGALADTTGHFVIARVDTGGRDIEARGLAVLTATQHVLVRAGETTYVEFRLTASATALDAVRIEARATDRETFTDLPSVGLVSISGKAVSDVPRLGEPDVLRVAQLMPGVEARNDFTAGLNVRGGEADQNLILLDGYPIFNPFHFGGLFGTFIDAAVGGIQLRTGGFPAQYGGRLSSVLDVTSSEEDRSGLHGTADVSLLSSSVTLGSAFANGEGSLMVAARRTYADLLLKAIGRDALPYYCDDIQAHAVFRPTPATEIGVTFYTGRDNLSLDLAVDGDTTDAASTADGALGFWWGNTVLGTTITHVLPGARLPLAGWKLGDSATVEQRLSVSQFSTQLNVANGGLFLANTVRELNATGSLRWTVPKQRLSLGYELSQDHLVYTTTSTEANEDFFDSDQRPTAFALHVDDVWSPTRRWLVEMGAREEAVSGTGWTGLSPRLSAKFFVTPDFALSLALGRYTQWLHSLDREDIPFRLFDSWRASDSTAPVSRATHVILGAERWVTSSRFFRVEAFLKNSDNLVEPNPSADPTVASSQFLPVTGVSYGADLYIRQLEIGRFGGWLAYTYGLNSREEADGTRFFPGQDRRHDLNVVGTYRLNRYLLSARYNFATGTPYTDIIGEIVRRDYDVLVNLWDPVGRSGDVEAVGGPLDGARLPTTQRLDLSITRDFAFDGATFTPVLSVVNALNARNVFMYVFDYTSNPPTRTAFSQLPFIPTIGVTVTW